MTGLRDQEVALIGLTERPIIATRPPSAQGQAACRFTVIVDVYFAGSPTGVGHRGPEVVEALGA